MLFRSIDADEDGTVNNTDGNPETALKDEPAKDSQPATGDSAPIGLLAALMLSALISIALTMRFRKC